MTTALSIGGLLKTFDLDEGVTESHIDGVRFIRISGSSRRQPAVYEPQIVLVGQGRKIGYLNDQVFVYDSGHYLLLAVQLPFECETTAEPGEPYLALSIDIDVQILGEIIHELDEVGDLPRAVSCVNSIPLDDDFNDAAIRLITALKSRVESRILGPSLLKELTYRAISGPGGESLMALASRHTAFSRVAKVIRHIHADYGHVMTVENLAHRANMSVSGFHHAFKQITTSSPLQYIKSVRLHKARLMISQDGLSAGAAAERVGYASQSQFSREYKRFFGESPIRDSRRYATD